MSKNDLVKLTNELLKRGVSVNSYLIRDEKRMVVGRTFDIDFTEHDKVFENKISEMKNEISMLKSLIDNYRETEGKLYDENESLKKRIADLEKIETADLPFDPLECANYLINSTYERETNGFERALHNVPDKVSTDRYDIDDLEQIAEHLLVYCKHNKENDNE